MWSVPFYLVQLLIIKLTSSFYSDQLWINGPEKLKIEKGASITLETPSFLWYILLFCENFIPVKYIIGAFLFITLFSRCASSTPEHTTYNMTAFPDAEKANVKGLYKGDFAGDPIYITINFSSGKHVAGYNVHKGLRRNLSGTMLQTANGWEVEINEPGDHPFDGTFKLTFDSSFTSAKGEWKPLNTSSTLTAKQFTITRTKVAADNEDGEVYHNLLEGDHADITFQKDGNCIFNYYDKINDSTFAEQMNTVRGTWEKKDSSLLVSWHKTAQWNKDKSIFTIKADAPEENGGITTVTGEGYEFTTPF